MTINICAYVSPAAHHRQEKPKTDEALRYFELAKRYLEHSETAMDVIGLLQVNGVNLVICPDGETEVNKLIYSHTCSGGCRLWPSLIPGGLRDSKEQCDGGRCIVWSAQKSLIGKERTASYRTWRRIRRDHEWFQFQSAPRLMSNFRGLFTDIPNGTHRLIDNELLIPGPVLLIHEMGHALQQILDPADFLELSRGGGDRRCPPLDVLNVASIENAVCMELRQAGKLVGIRWLYRDSSDSDVVMNEEWIEDTKTRFMFTRRTVRYTYSDYMKTA